MKIKKGGNEDNKVEKKSFGKFNHFFSNSLGNRLYGKANDSHK